MSQTNTHTNIGFLGYLEILSDLIKVVNNIMQKAKRKQPVKISPQEEEKREEYKYMESKGLFIN